MSRHEAARAFAAAATASPIHWRASQCLPMPLPDSMFNGVRWYRWSTFEDYSERLNALATQAVRRRLAP